MDSNWNNHERYLCDSPIIDYRESSVSELADYLAGNSATAEDLVRATFYWVRDNIDHSLDIGAGGGTCAASDVLRAGHGFCYAKSHLLTALLRANNIASGFCYQRLSNDAGGFALHGFNGVYLPAYGWYRIDPRGNKPGINADFTPPGEKLAYSCKATGEVDYQSVFAEPWPTVVWALQTCNTVDELLLHLPERITMG